VITDDPGGGIRGTVPITFLGAAGLDQDVVVEQFLRDPRVIEAVSSINAASDEAARAAAVNRLVEGLG
jgi:hypothetical protein